MTEPPSQISRAKRYARTSAWILRDGLRGMATRVVVVIIADAVSVASAVAAFMTLLGAAWRAEAGQSLAILRQTIELDGAKGWLVVAGVALGLGLLSAFCFLASELIVHGLARRYHTQCERRVLGIAARPDAADLVATAADRVGVTLSLPRLAAGTVVGCALGLRSLVRVVLPLMATVAAAIGLLWLDAPTTGVIAALFIPYLIPLVIINRGVARLDWEHRRLSTVVMGRVRRWLRAMDAGNESLRDPRIWEPVLLGNGEFDGMQDALYGRLLANKKVSFLNAAFSITCLVAVVICAVLRGDVASWTVVVAYLFVLRFTWGAIRSFTGALVTANRFFREFEAFIAVTEAARTSTPVATTTSLEHPITLPAAPLPGVEGDGQTVELRAGGVTLAFVAAADVLVAFSVMETVLRDAGSTVAVHRHAGTEMMPGARLVEQAIGVDASPEDREALCEDLSALGVMESIDALPQGLDTVVTETLVADLGPEAAAAVTASHLLRQPPGIVLLSVSDLRPLRRGFVDRLLERLTPHAVVLVDVSTKFVRRPKFRTLQVDFDAALVVDVDGTLRGGRAERIWDCLVEVEAILAEGRPAASAEEKEPEIVIVDE